MGLGLLLLDQELDLRVDLVVGLVLEDGLGVGDCRLVGCSPGVGELGLQQVVQSSVDEVDLQILRALFGLHVQRRLGARRLDDGLPVRRHLESRRQVQVVLLPLLQPWLLSDWHSGRNGLMLISLVLRLLNAVVAVLLLGSPMRLVVVNQLPPELECCVLDELSVYLALFTFTSCVVLPCVLGIVTILRVERLLDGLIASVELELILLVESPV